MDIRKRVKLIRTYIDKYKRELGLDGCLISVRFKDIGDDGCDMTLAEIITEDYAYSKFEVIFYGKLMTSEEAYFKEHAERVCWHELMHAALAPLTYYTKRKKHDEYFADLEEAAITRLEIARFGKRRT